MYLSALSSGEDGHVVVTLQLVLVTPAVAVWAERVPDGLLAVDPWLVPPPRE